MDAKITRKRLGEFLAYEWVKIVAIAVALVVVWSVLFACTGTRITPDQRFTVINYAGTATNKDFNTLDDTLENNNVFSYEVAERKPLDATYEDMVDDLLESRFSTSDGDVMLVADVNNGIKVDQRDAQGNIVYTEYADGSKAPAQVEQTYLQQFLQSKYLYAAMPLRDVETVVGTNNYQKEGLLGKVERYLANFFVVEGAGDDARFKDFKEDGKKVAEEMFRARVKETKDKRFRNERLIKAGIEQELERLVSYRNGYNAFMNNIAEGKIVPTTTQIVFEGENNKLVLRGQYGINICPDETVMRDLKNLVYYETEDKGTSAANLNVLFLNVGDSREEFLGEKLLFVNFLVSRYTKAGA